MRIIHNLDEMTETARGWLAGGSVGFVPTMGSLHQGHISLVQAAHQECEISVASIFVNPLQFEESDDLLRYPRDLSRDLQLLSTTNIDVVFIPRTEDIYPAGFSTFVMPTSPLWAVQPAKGTGSRIYARGVATIITKLFQLVRPDIAYFGRKNAQQIAIVRQVVRDLNIDVGLRILPTVRESDGLALGSRNHFLTQPERQAASVLYRALLAGKALVDVNVRNCAEIEKAMMDLVVTEPLVNLDYVKVCHSDTLSSVDTIVPGTMLMIAAHIGKVHFIDNIIWRGGTNWLL
ncbi:MAG: pantoate--beta-alanine ligase [Ktedonobacter sp. 13_1_20CM_4_53_11]|nr:MAG: pantoate--beta-alanine ligase [Ktedonobacter sp. 13_2_20CM_2_56_8]OLE07627.1 MAG: pantoate--beta-alanine ligase [Ktedonobacter sp. 13_1_20CM_4_53_11]